MQLTLSTIPQQQQNLTITPQIQQSIEILQFSYEDLIRYLQELAAENPFLELNANACSTGYRRYESSRTMEYDWRQNIPSRSEPTLESFLMGQLHELKLDKAVYTVCKFVIGNLDERGYFPHDAGWIAGLLKISREEADEAIRIVQCLEPAGIAAFSLEHCLLLQLEQYNKANSLACTLVANDLPNIAKGKMDYLAKKYSVPVEDIKLAIGEIVKLDPKPGAGFHHPAKTPYIAPDLILHTAEDHFELVAEREELPLVSPNLYYLNMLEQELPQETAKFLRTKWQHAKWILESLKMRKSTLVKVASVIFEKQSEFCLKGPPFIRPLTMAQVADELNFHESTVSRAVNGKYVLTPWGIFELKHFFPSSLKQAGGAVSSVHIKYRIRELIREEDLNHPYSDQQIAERLERERITVSRRTVAKYREQMNILSAALRKRR